MYDQWAEDRTQKAAFLPTAYRLLPTAFCLLPSAYCLPPTAYGPRTNYGFY